MRKNSNPEAGFSFIAVLIVMGVVTFSIMLISQAKFKAQSAQKSIKVKQSYGDINQALINNVVEVFHERMSNACDNLAQTQINNRDLDGNVRFRYNTNPGFNGVSNTLVPEVHKQAQARCRVPKAPNGGNRFYFCTSLTQDASAAKDTILNSKYAFAEFAIELIDLQTQNPITCAEYTTRINDKVAGVPRDGSAGMAVTMALYWANEANGANKFTFSQKALSYIANQN